MRHFVLVFVTMALFAADEPLQPKTDDTAKRQAYLGLAIDAAATTFEGHGLVVLRVEPNSPAAVMGIAGGDRITHVDGNPLKIQEDLAKWLKAKNPGERVVIAALRTQGQNGGVETITYTGVLQELPRSRTSSLGNQLNELQARLAELEDKAKEPTLAEILERLHAIEQDLPKAAAAFKRIYPDGEFRIAISVEVTSHKTAPDPLAIDVGGRVDDPAPATDAVAPEKK